MWNWGRKDKHHVLQILPGVASGYLKSELWSVHAWIYHEDKKFILHQVYCIIFCECVLQRQIHIQKRHRAWCTACWIFPDGMLAYSASRSGNSMFLRSSRAPFQPMPTAPPWPPGMISCLFFSLLHGFGFLHSILCLWACCCSSVISTAVEYSLCEDITIHLSVLLLMAIWVLSTLWLSRRVLPWAVCHVSFGKHMESPNALLLITVCKIPSAFLANSGSSLWSRVSSWTVV